MGVCGVGNEDFFAEGVPKYRLEAENQVPCREGRLLCRIGIDIGGHPADARFFTHVDIVRQFNVVAFFRVETNLKYMVVDEVGKVEGVPEMLLRISLGGIQIKRNRFSIHIQFHLVNAARTGI